MEATLPAALIEEVVLDTLIDLEAAFPAAFRALDLQHEEELKRLIEEQASRLNSSEK